MLFKNLMFFFITLFCLNTFIYTGGSKKTALSQKKKTIAAGAAAAAVTQPDSLDAEFDKLVIDISAKDSRDESGAASAAGAGILTTETSGAGAAASAVSVKTAVAAGVPVQATYVDAFFSPGLATELLQLIGLEEKGIDAAIYEFTLLNVAKALVEKSKQLKKVSVVVDAQPLKEGKVLDSAVKYLIASKKIEVLGNNTNPKFSEGKFSIMHHKFIIFSQNKRSKRSLVWTGSFNLTGQANTKSWENVTVTDDPGVVAKFSKEYDILKRYSKPLKESDIMPYKNRPSLYALKINGIE